MQSVRSPLLNPYTQITHAFSTKEDGFSLKPFSQNNLAYHVNDNPKHVFQNHQHFALYLQYDLKKLVHMNQVHGNSISIIDKSTDLNHIPKCDALITQEKNIPLMVMVADCIPILLYDPIKEIIAVVHAGRAGVFNKILIKTINKMTSNFKTDAKDLLVVLGPSIKECCYDVDMQIKVEAIKHNYGYSINEKKDSYYLDLVSIIKEQLKELHIENKNIEISNYCTSCNNKLFFSYRADKNITGRFCGLLMLR
ncbi:MAG: hypothetical protein COA44_14470 [Arcobacter sp.]|nr:MAG: hypothetical protein COA44_14470 [Arcobacter sp.]